MLTLTGAAASMLLAAGFTDDMGFLARQSLKPAVEVAAFATPNAEKLGARPEVFRSQARAGLVRCGFLPRQSGSSPVNVAAVVSVAAVVMKDGWWAANVNLSLKTTYAVEGTRVAIDLFTDSSLVAGAPGEAGAKLSEELTLLLKDACTKWADALVRTSSAVRGK
jgi:hypothetical protein